MDQSLNDAIFLSDIKKIYICLPTLRANIINQEIINRVHQKGDANHQFLDASSSAIVVGLECCLAATK